MSHDLTDKRWIPSIKQAQGFQRVSFHLITPYLSQVFTLWPFLLLFLSGNPIFVARFLFGNPTSHWDGSRDCISLWFRIGWVGPWWDHGGTGSAQEPPRLQPPHLSVYPAFNTLILPPLLKHFEYFNTWTPSSLCLLSMCDDDATPKPAPFNVTNCK